MLEIKLRETENEMTSLTIGTNFISIFTRHFECENKNESTTIDIINIPVKNIGNVEYNMVRNVNRFTIPKGIQITLIIIVILTIIMTIGREYTGALIGFLSGFILLLVTLFIAKDSEQLKRTLVIKDNDNKNLYEIEFLLTIEQFNTIVESIRKLQ